MTTETTHGSRSCREIKMTPSALIEQLQAAYQVGASHAPVGGGSLFDEIFPTLHKKGKP
jgi:hypothetical protein